MAASSTATPVQRVLALAEVLANAQKELAAIADTLVTPVPMAPSTATPAATTVSAKVGSSVTYRLSAGDAAAINKRFAAADPPATPVTVGQSFPLAVTASIRGAVNGSVKLGNGQTFAVASVRAGSEAGQFSA